MRHKRAMLSVFFFVAACSGLAAPMRPWRELPELPGKITPGALAVAGDALLAIGGGELVFDTDYWFYQSYSTVIYRLDAAEEGWYACGKLPVPSFVGGHAVSTPKGIFVLGSENKTKTLRAYLVALQKTTCEVTALPEPDFSNYNYFGKPASIGNTVYILARNRENLALAQLDLSVSSAAWSFRTIPRFPVDGNLDLIGLGNSLYWVRGDDIPMVTLDQFNPSDLTWREISSNKLVHENPFLASAISVEDNFILTVGRPLMLFSVAKKSWIRFESNPFTDNTPTDAILWNGNIVVQGVSHKPMLISSLQSVARKHFGIADYIALFGYFAVTAGIGSYFSRRNTGTDEYFLGSRRIPWWAVGLSIYGTAVSSITYLAIPGAAYSGNWVTMLANTGIFFVAPLVTWFYIPRYRAQPIATAYEFLELRFNLATRIYGSAVFVLYQVGRISVVLFLPSLALSAATGLNVYVSIVLMGVVTTLYTMTGGIEAVIWTDVMQSIVLIGGAVLALAIIALNLEHGVSDAVVTAWNAEKFHTFNLTWDITSMSLWVCLVGNAFSTMYPMTADQCVVQRYLTTATDAQARKAVWTNALLSIPTTFMFFGIGTALWVYYQQHPERVDHTLPNDAVLPMFVVDRFPAGLGGLLIAGIFAAAMSTLSSSMNSVATVLSRDYYRRWRPDLSDASELRFARGVTLLFGVGGIIIAVVMATLDIPSLFEQWLKILNLVGGGLGGVMALGIFTRRANGVGAIAGAILSTVVVLAIQRYTAIHFFMYATFGFLTAFIGGYAVSLLVPDHRKT